MKKRVKDDRRKRPRPIPCVTQRVWGFSKVYRKKLLILDLDGTLADNTQRRGLIPLDKTRGEDWVLFNSACGEDEIIHRTAQLVGSLATVNHDVVFATGRSEGTRDHTLSWIKDRLIPEYPQLWRHDIPDNLQLFMRPDDDHRSGAECKLDLFRSIMFALKYSELDTIIVDDDPDVIRLTKLTMPEITLIHVPSFCSSVNLQLSRK